MHLTRAQLSWICYDMANAGLRTDRAHGLCAALLQGLFRRRNESDAGDQHLGVCQRRRRTGGRTPRPMARQHRRRERGTQAFSRRLSRHRSRGDARALLHRAGRCGADADFLLYGARRLHGQQLVLRRAAAGHCEPRFVRQALFAFVCVGLCRRRDSVSGLPRRFAAAEGRGHSRHPVRVRGGGGMVDRAGDPDVPVREGAETEGGAPGQCAGRIPQTLADRLRDPGSTATRPCFSSPTSSTSTESARSS